MGLLYPFPISEDEQDHAIIEESSKQLTLKSYGLPYAFWFYFAAILVVITTMTLISWSLLMKMMVIDFWTRVIAISTLTVLFSIPTSLILFFFYEKRIIKNKDKIILSHHFFGQKVRSVEHTLKSQDAFEIKRFDGTPTVAKKENREEMKGFFNKGYFELFAETNQGNWVLVDRHSIKNELKRMGDLLSRY